MPRVLIYARVSTKEQNIEMQLIDLRAYAKARKLEIVGEFLDFASGSKSDRTNYIKLFDWVRKKKTDIVLVWKFDRFARSTRELINALEEFRSLGVDFLSFKENIDTLSPAGKILFTMISAFAEFEREIIRERVKSGMEKAKMRGENIGRPKIPKVKINAVFKMRKKGVGYLKICQQLKISKSAYYMILKSRD